MSGAAFEHGCEWPCSSCDDADYASEHGSPGAPSDVRCYADECPADLECLRELEAQVALAISYTSGALRICATHHREALCVLEDAIAEILAGTYGDAHVAQSDIRQRIHRTAEEKAVVT